jgi:DNA-binding response OmpR family regulator
MSPSHQVLLVDDDQDLLTALSGALRQRGYDVITAPDAVSAMSTAVEPIALGRRDPAASRDAALAAGAAEYLAKPVGPDVLAEAVVRVLGTAGAD